ncbi:hypothetical protein C8035_v003060 [Colletotrichum spinosum]|uniref:Uncharacterized protein n=1 Tax=Colletotrichum spinosum TaxID=1347390 RepID=A0A4R8PRX2_9PEZI|nr:hypothetical protein C8035_v003060 [Colletotrichum spinosum]
MGLRHHQVGTTVAYEKIQAFKAALQHQFYWRFRTFGRVIPRVYPRYPGTSPAFLLDNGRLVLPQPVQRYGWIYNTSRSRPLCRQPSSIPISLQ